MIDLLTQAERDFKLVESIYSSLPEPWAIQAIMYHIQQAIEKLLKVILLLNGARYPREHNIRRLMSLCTGIELPEELEDLADTLSLWEAGVRYDSTVLTSVRKLDQCIALYNKLHHLVVSLACDTDATNYFEQP